MRLTWKRFFVFFGLVVISDSCSQTKYYSRDSKLSGPHGGFSYQEIQFHEDGIYEEFEHIIANNSESWNYNGRYKKIGDTILIYGIHYRYNEIDSIMERTDSLYLSDRYFKSGRKIQHCPLYDPNSKIEFKRGKSRKLRRKEKADSLIFENYGYLRRPFGGLCYYHGVKGHTKSCNLCL